MGIRTIPTTIIRGVTLLASDASDASFSMRSNLKGLLRNSKDASQGENFCFATVSGVLVCLLLILPYIDLWGPQRSIIIKDDVRRLCIGRINKRDP